ncbi:MAG TPA: polyphenol oxidase family protein [Longimicrobium sp.]|nr:polyphenol oxidase family protein [Longimicrobium sp.]
MIDAAAAVARTVEERLVPGDVPLWVHPEWSGRFGWLAQGTTGRGSADEPFDLGLGGERPAGAALDRWRRLAAATGMSTAVHSRQVHGTDIWVHRERGAPAICVMDGFDGHATERAGLLVAVGIADCTPVSIVDAERRCVALVHAGWRGAAAGIVERGIALLAAEWGSAADALWLHCGPAICGRCYEVGPEVHAAIHPDRPPPPGKATIDVRAAIVGRAVGAGVRAERITVSAHCTRCGGGEFFSHRGGDLGRQYGVLGIREGG